jgi:hypothetical protein
MFSAGFSFARPWMRSPSAPLLRLHRLSRSLLAERYELSLDTEVATLSLRSFLGYSVVLSFVVKLDKIISSSIGSNSWPASSGTIVGFGVEDSAIAGLAIEI